MELFNKLFVKKTDTVKNEIADKKIQIEKTLNNKIEGEFVEKLNIDTSQTLEKFLHLKDEIFAFLMHRLKELHKLEQEIFERSQALKNPKQPNQVQPGEKELWAEYNRRRKEITDPISLKASEEGSGSFGKPTKYEYLTYPDTKIIFIMKSNNRAVIETQFKYGIIRREQFVLKKDQEDWKVDTKKYGFQNENLWHKDVL